MFNTSIKVASEAYKVPPTLWPDNPTLRFYELIFKVTVNNPVLRYPLWIYLKNSFIITAGTMLIQIPVVSLLAYAISKLHRARISRFLFLYCIGVIMVPSSVALIPSYLLLKHFPFPTMNIPRTPFTNMPFPTYDFIGTYWGVILPGIYSAFFFLLFKGFFDTIPDELINAARLDGASELGIFRRIVFPVSKPVFAVVAYFSFSVTWNNFLWTLIVLQKNRLYPMSVALYRLQQWVTEYNPLNPDPLQAELMQAGIGINGVMVISIIQSVPMFIMFVVFREYLMTGIRLRGFK